MLHGTELERFCIVWDPEEDLCQLLTKITISPEEIEQRRNELKQIFSPENYVRVIEQILDESIAF